MRAAISISVIFLAFAIAPLDGKRNRDRRNNGENSGNDRKTKKEDTCVMGYCLDPMYNKLELPTSDKTHVRMNLEVRSRLHVYVFLFGKIRECISSV